MESYPTELARPDNKLCVLFEQFTQPMDTSDHIQLFRRIMDMPAYSVHGLGIKARALVLVLETQQIEMSEIMGMVKVFAGSVTDLADGVDMPTIGQSRPPTQSGSTIAS